MSTPSLPRSPSQFVCQAHQRSTLRRKERQRSDREGRERAPSFVCSRWMCSFPFLFPHSVLLFPCPLCRSPTSSLPFPLLPLLHIPPPLRLCVFIHCRCLLLI